VHFQTSRERVKRAKTHRQAFGKAWSDFLDEPDPYDIGVHVEDDGTGELWIQPSRPLPVVLSLELGELLYQLRAALDACIYQAAIIDSGQDPPPDENALEFPICATEKTFEASAWKIAPLTNQRIRKFIRDIQPCNIPKLKTPGAEWMPETLTLLNEWARKDRHRKLHVVGSWPSEADPQLRLPEGVTILSMKLVGLGLLLDEQKQLATFALNGWKRGMKIEANPNAVIDVASDEPPPPKESFYTLSMRAQQMIAAVEFIVTKIFEKAY
jgi:hypothetical protein